jgi:hypothetical protein
MNNARRVQVDAFVQCKVEHDIQQEVYAAV